MYVSVTLRSLRKILSLLKDYCMQYNPFSWSRPVAQGWLGLMQWISISSLPEVIKSKERVGMWEQIQHQRKCHQTEEMWCFRALSTDILSVLLKYTACLPGVWEASWSLDKPVCHQRFLSMFSDFQTMIQLSYQHHIDPGCKVWEQYSSCPRK